MPQAPIKIHPVTRSLSPGYRVRRDGWTVDKQHRFLALLRHSGCVMDACRVIGMSTTSAYRFRNLFPEFAAEWDKQIGYAQQALEAIAYKRAVEGAETIIIRNGVEYERRITPSDTMLALLIKRGRLNQSAYLPDDEVISRAEFQAGYYFDEHTGEKKKLGYSRDEARTRRAELIAKLMKIRERNEEKAAQERQQDDLTQPFS